MDSNPDLAQYVLETEVTANQERRKLYLKALNSSLSLHSCGIESEEVPQKWLLIFSTYIQV